MISRFQFLSFFILASICCLHYPGVSLGADFIALADSQMIYKTSSVLSTSIPAGIESVTIDGIEYSVIPGTTNDWRLILLENKLLFSGGDYGSANFRIPAVKTAKDGSLVVAVDARIDKPGDLPNDIDIMVRRSTNLGHSWSDAITIADFGEYGASDPALVLDRNTGDLLCLFASHRGLMQSTPSNRIRFQVCRSKDNGQTWSAPQEFTNQIYAPGWYAAWLASGSAHRMRDGTIGCFYENGEYEEYQLYFTRFSLDWLSSGNDTYTFPIGIDESIPGDNSIKIIPNPTDHTFGLILELIEKSSIHSSIVNIAGQEMMTIMEERLDAGIHHCEVSLTGCNAGIYLMKTKVNEVVLLD